MTNETKRHGRITGRGATLRALRGAGLALALGAGLAACGGPNGPATRIYAELLDSAYSPNQINAGSIPTPVQVLGTPPDGSDAAAVAGGMRMPARFGSGTFVPATEQDMRGPRAVLAFNPSGRLRSCEGAVVGRGGEGRNGRMEALLAWCDGTKELSSLMISSGASQGPKDDKFERAMSQAMNQLLPSRNPAIGGGEASARRVPGG
ncbi:hypothetical protein SAMN05444336_101509 [Albimonas donghaensis]|uniref:Uncharacterized protein n=1 Tax=Albimonas donghaensis TaxID=356660 RepID=A0A1H2S1M8_9RHOB|nr:hypothetical protein [Albimonas donghaensis]SDW25024.1 hypothetical protein SAMN05444336_101509 [Albimonas donghaensis]